MSWQCPKCGRTTDGSILRCVCGYELDTPLNDEQEILLQNRESSEVAIDKSLPKLVSTSLGNFNEHELRAFIDKEADYYLIKWWPRLGGQGHWAGFNWAAFFLTDLWLAYRKMYKAIFIYYGAKIAGVVLLESILGKSRILEIIAGLIIGTVCGVFGNIWYLNRTIKVINEIRSQGLKGEAYLQSLSKFGGTNIRLSIVLLILFIAFEVLSYLVK